MERRLTYHPILDTPERPKVRFTFRGKPCMARQGETIASALYANDIRVFGLHPKDRGPQGLFCANGQCSQCLCIADGRPVKACMVPVTEDMIVEPLGAANPALPVEDAPPSFTPPEQKEVQVLVVGAGPSGICAASELGRQGISVLVIDDKAEMGGKLSLQTHPFFGSIRACHAGTRGIHLTSKLSAGLSDLPNVEIRLNTTAVGVFNDGTLGLVSDKRYMLVKPRVLLVAAGAREKSLSFPGCDLPGVYGAGAFQTLVNRDRICSADWLFIVGGGNVGLIAGYHALQANIRVVGLVEAMKEIGGYKVHLDKLKRLGVPVWTRHTVVRAEGDVTLQRVVISACDDRFKPVEGTERSFDVDTLLIAVGLSPVDELTMKAKDCGLDVFAAGDADAIAEASAAIFSGRIMGRKIASFLGRPARVPDAWVETASVLRSRPGPSHPLDLTPPPDLEIFPVIHCNQEIPCNPCTQVCPLGSIAIPDGSITSPPSFSGKCLGCGKCVLICPGLAIKLVLPGTTSNTSLLMLPWEFGPDAVKPDQQVTTVDMEGNTVGQGTVKAIRERQDQNRRRLLLLEVPRDERMRVVGFKIQPEEAGRPAPSEIRRAEEADPIVCRCERVRRSTIENAIRAGVRDLNVLKAVTRASMGGCGGRTCTELVQRIFRELGVSPAEVVSGTVRPPFNEIKLSLLAGIDDKGPVEHSGSDVPLDPLSDAPAVPDAPPVPGEPSGGEKP